jgi:Predicted acetyltransferase
MNVENVRLEKIEFQNKEMLENVYQFYLYDMSVYNNVDIDTMGLYDVDFLNMFWKEEGLTAFFIKIAKKIAGVILLQSGKWAPPTSEDYYISEFFVLKKYRRNGVGKKALKELFCLYPGKYMLGQLPNNNPAINFWKSVYSEFNINYIESFEDKILSGLLCQRFEV